MASGDVRGVAAGYVFLGLLAASFALYAISLHPATLPWLQLQQLEQQDQGGCACAAATMEMRDDAAVLLLLAAAQTMTATVAVAGASRILTVSAQIQSLPMAWGLLQVLDGVVDLAIQRCHGHGTNHQLLVVSVYFNITLSFVLLFIYGLLVAFRGQV